jgi:hypothetical protein
MHPEVRQIGPGNCPKCGMALEPEASFIAGASLSAVGVVTLKKAETKAELPFAMIPMLFGIQQLTEGIIWLTFRYNAPLLKETTTYFTWDSRTCCGRCTCLSPLVSWKPFASAKRQSSRSRSPESRWDFTRFISW